MFAILYTLVVDEGHTCAKRIFIIIVFLLQQFNMLPSILCLDFILSDVSIQTGAGGQAAVIGGKVSGALCTGWTTEWLVE